MKNLLFIFVFAVVAGISAGTASAQVSQRVRFAKGASEATLKAVIKGYDYRDYLFTAAAGQKIEVKLTSTGSPSVFSVFKPKGGNLEIASETDSFNGEIPEKGDYVIRVLMMRSVARRRAASSSYTLKFSIK